MVRCLPLWAIFAGFFSHFWLCTIIVTYLPTYISSVLHVNVRDVSTLLVRLWKRHLQRTQPVRATYHAVALAQTGLASQRPGGRPVGTRAARVWKQGGGTAGPGSQ